MGLFDRLSRVVRSNLNAAVSAAEDPEKILEQALIDMQEQLLQLRQAVANAIATLKREEQQLSQAETDVNTWTAKAKLALEKGNETLAKEALVRKKGYVDSSNLLRPQVEEQRKQVEKLKGQLLTLEAKIAEAKTKKNILVSRAKTAKANEQVNKTLSGINPASALSAFERMEEKVLELEARSDASVELGGTGIDQQFAALESSDVDDELAALKAQVSGAALPPASSPAAESLRLAADSLDDELAKLKANNQ